MALGLLESLPTLVRNRYSAASAANALSFAASELSIVNVGDVKYQLRFCPSLAKKPRALPSQTPQPAIDDGKSGNGESPPKKVDPFENPSSDLLVDYVPRGDPSHVIVLNKFPIIREHFILATKENKPQTHLLEAGDLGVAYECLKAWEEGPDQDAAKRRLFAFFNSGDHSGASQPHRHIQFLPVESIQEGDTSGEWSLLADDIVYAPDTETGELSYFRSHRSLPFQHFGTRLPPDPSPMTLHQTYTNLYHECLAISQDYEDDHPGEMSFHSTKEGDLPISYNLAMTTSAMIMCPRRSEGLTINDKEGTPLDLVSLNGTLLGGTIMVKKEETYKLLQNDKRILQEVFETAGLPAALRRITSYVSL